MITHRLPAGRDWVVRERSDFLGLPGGKLILDMHVYNSLEGRGNRKRPRLIWSGKVQGIRDKFLVFQTSQVEKPLRVLCCWKYVFGFCSSGSLQVQEGASFVDFILG